MPATLRALWLRMPFRHMIALVIVLYVVKEQFPFSNFPMYSNFENEADVVYITDQSDQVQPMQKLFGTKSAQTKKTYVGELARLTNPQKRDTNAATAAERAQAGKTVLAGLIKRLRPKAVAPGTTALRLYLRTFMLHEHALSDAAPERLAEQSL